MASVAMTYRHQILAVGQTIGTVWFRNVRQRLKGLEGFLDVVG
jgi:hypothetical protein